MISLKKCSGPDSVGDLKKHYLESLTAPMDGMWEVGFIDPADHWEIRYEGETAGFFVTSNDGALLQFYVKPRFEVHARNIFDVVAGQESIERAVVSTIDPLYLSLCLETASKKPSVHTYLFEARTEIDGAVVKHGHAVFRLVGSAELKQTVAFQIDCLGGESELKDWLRGYSANLINRRELYVLTDEQGWLGLGEFRVSDTQPGIVDLGVMVSPKHRSSGWATDILLRLRMMSDKEQLIPICSTTVDNEGALKSIQKAGFLSRHRILNIAF